MPLISYHGFVLFLTVIQIKIQLQNKMSYGIIDQADDGSGQQLTRGIHQKSSFGYAQANLSSILNNGQGQITEGNNSSDPSSILVKLYGPSMNIGGRGSNLDSSFGFNRPSAGTNPKLIKTRDGSAENENLSDDSAETGAHFPLEMVQVTGLIASKEVQERQMSPAAEKLSHGQVRIDRNIVLKVGSLERFDSEDFNQIHCYSSKQSPTKKLAASIKGDRPSSLLHNILNPAATNSKQLPSQVIHAEHSSKPQSVGGNDDNSVVSSKYDSGNDTKNSQKQANNGFILRLPKGDHNNHQYENQPMTNYKESRADHQQIQSAFDQFTERNVENKNPTFRLPGQQQINSIAEQQIQQPFSGNSTSVVQQKFQKQSRPSQQRAISPPSRPMMLPDQAASAVINNLSEPQQLQQPQPFQVAQGFIPSVNSSNRVSKMSDRNSLYQPEQRTAPQHNRRSSAATHQTRPKSGRVYQHARQATTKVGGAKPSAKEEFLQLYEAHMRKMQLDEGGCETKTNYRSSSGGFVSQKQQQQPQSTATNHIKRNKSSLMMGNFISHLPKYSQQQQIQQNKPLIIHDGSCTQDNLILPYEQLQNNISNKQHEVLHQQQSLRYDQMTRKYLEGNNQVLIDQSSKRMASIRYTSTAKTSGVTQSSQNSRRVKSMGGVVSYSKAISSATAKGDFKNMPFVERQLKQKEFFEQLNEFKRAENSSKVMEKCSFKPNITASQRSRSPPQNISMGNGNSANIVTTNSNNFISQQKFNSNFRSLNSDLLIRPLDGQAIQKDEAHKVQTELEIIEQAKYEREYAERKRLYNKMRVTYQKQLSKLDRSVSPVDASKNYMSKLTSSANFDSTTAKKMTFRKQLYQEDVTAKPQINKSTEKFLLRRNRSTGNITSDLYRDSLMRHQRQSSNQKLSRQRERSISNSSVLENATGLAKGQSNNSDKYLAIKLTKEFDEVLKDLQIKADEEISREMLYEIFVKLRLLKPLEQLNSEFITAENLSIFESSWLQLIPFHKLMPEKVRFFFLNLNYLWGGWLQKEKLLAGKNLPDRAGMSPMRSNKKILHSVPRVKITVDTFKPKQPQQQQQLILQKNTQQLELQSINYPDGYLSNRDTAAPAIMFSERFAQSGTTTPDLKPNPNKKQANTLGFQSDQATPPLPNAIHEQENEYCYVSEKPFFGAQSEAECRKLIKEYSLLNINRWQNQRDKVIQNAERQHELLEMSQVQERPALSHKSKSLARKRRSQTDLQGNLFKNHQDFSTPFQLPKRVVAPQYNPSNDAELLVEQDKAAASSQNDDEFSNRMSNCGLNLLLKKDSSRRGSMDLSQSNNVHKRLFNEGIQMVETRRRQHQQSMQQLHPSCTFKPNHKKQFNRKKSSSIIESNKSTSSASCQLDQVLQEKVNGVQIGQRLHSKKIKSKLQQEVKSKDDIEFSKNMKEMTFKPKILKKSTPNRQSITKIIPNTKIDLMSQHAKLTHNKRLHEQYNKMMHPSKKSCQISEQENAEPITKPAQAWEVCERNYVNLTQNFQCSASLDSIELGPIRDRPYRKFKQIRPQMCRLSQMRKPLQIEKEPNRYSAATILEKVNDSRRSSVIDVIDEESYMTEKACLVTPLISERREPLLFLDVNLGQNKSAKIVINEGEDYQQIVDQFGIEHQLSDKKTTKLLNIIVAQLDLISEKNLTQSRISETQETTANESQR